MNERERISFIIIQRKSIIQINFKVGNYLMTQNYIHEIGQVEPPPESEDGEVPGTGDHNDDNEDPA